MTITNPHLESGLRQAFKYFNRGMVLLWRLGLGHWVNIAPRYGGQVMVLVHQGRKSGKHRFTPLNYAIIEGELYCTAGFGHVSDWYQNVLANPQVEVWLPDGCWEGIAEEISDPVWRLPLLRSVLIGSGFASYLAGIDPHTLAPDELATKTAPYCLLHIQRTQKRAYPGDLAWVWGLVLLWMGLALLWRDRK